MTLTIRLKTPREYNGKDKPRRDDVYVYKDIVLTNNSSKYTFSFALLTQAQWSKEDFRILLRYLG